MAQQSIFGRISQLARANINSIIDNAEDPEKMLDQMIRDYTANITEAEQAVAQTIGNLRLMEADRDEDAAAARDWGSKAIAASGRGDQLRDAGQHRRGRPARQPGQDRHRAADQGRAGRVRACHGQIASQQAVVDKLRAGLEGMKGKLDELKSRRDELVVAPEGRRGAEPDARLDQEHQHGRPDERASRFEDKIRREEARALGNAELAASSLDNQFAELEDAGTTIEVESRLAALKSGPAARRERARRGPRAARRPGRPGRRGARRGRRPSCLAARLPPGGAGARGARRPARGATRHAGPARATGPRPGGLGGAARLSRRGARTGGPARGPPAVRAPPAAATLPG